MAVSACGGGNDGGATSGGSGNGGITLPPVSVSGSGVKGPLANASVSAYRVDTSTTDLQGALLGSGSTDATARIAGLSIPQDGSGMILLEFTADDDTVDIASGSAPVYSRLVTVVDTTRLVAGNPVYATPLTTMAVDLAQQQADGGLPYAGNGDGIISSLEFAAALSVAEGQVRSTLGFGLDSQVDIFTTPPLITSETDTPAEQADTAAYRQANEALAALTVYVSENSSVDDQAEDILRALVEDLGDGQIDGSGDDGAIDTLTALDQPIDQTLQMVDPAALLVPGTETPVAEIEEILVEEKATTGEGTDTSGLEDGSVDVSPDMPNLVSDIDGDGVPDSEDAFPEDPNETQDTDGDGVGDNADAFPENPNESADSDNDEVGDNADAFPNDPTETTDSDGDGVGDNSDVFPEDPGESADSDNDEVGDNADAFPNDPTETRDSDNDGVGDNADAFPEDPTETRDSDSDGVGDNSDAYPDDPERSVITSIDVNMWIGTGGADISFDGAVTGTDHYRSGESTCDIASYAVCADGQLDLLSNGIPVTDTATRTGQDAFHRFVDNGRTAELDVGIGRWGKRNNFGLVEFKGRMWVIGGFDDIYEGDGGGGSENGNDAGGNDEFDGWRANDVWSSQDGDVWVRHVEKAPFSSRGRHAVAVFQEKIWVVGGDDLNNPFLSDVWSSPDGVNWTEVTSSAAFGGRNSHRLVTYNDKLWLIGGTTEGFQYSNDVWYTEDGQSWVQATANAAWPANSYVGATAFQGKLWIFGGGGVYGGVWHSTDGAEWTNVPNSNYPARNVYSYTVWDNRIWIAGGFGNGGYRNDLWVSEDGETFTEVTRSWGHFWWPRTRAGLIGFKGRLWLMGGDNGGDFGDVHSTADGVDWRWHSFGPTGVPQRAGHEFLVFNDHFYTLSGGTYHVDQSVWRSADGLDWDEATREAPFGRREGLAAAVFNGRLWVVAGREMVADGMRNDVWSTADGVNWTREAESTQFGPRSGHKLVAWNEQLWLVGGANGSEDYSGEVWSSSDGVNWTQATADAGYPARSRFSVVVHNGRLFVIGGESFPDFFADVWSTGDGVNWRMDTDTLPFPGPSTSGYASIVYDGRILLVGGDASQREANHILSSEDGVNWTLEVADMGIPRRAAFGLAVKDGALWLNGGFWSNGLGYSQSDTWRSTNLTDWRVGFRRTVSFPPGE